jgi:hypothetical protein
MRFNMSRDIGVLALGLDICPVYLLQSFLRVRFSGIKGSDKLYVLFDGSALTRYQFCSDSSKMLKFL